MSEFSGFRRTFAEDGGGHLMQVFLIVGYVEGKQPGEVLAGEAMDKELADEFFEAQDFLHLQEHQLFTLGPSISDSKQR